MRNKCEIQILNNQNDKTWTSKVLHHLAYLESPLAVHCERENLRQTLVMAMQGTNVFELDDANNPLDEPL